MAYADNPDVQEYLRLKAQVEALRKQVETPYEELPSTSTAGGTARISPGNLIRNMAARKRGGQQSSQLSQMEQQMEQARIRALRGAEGQQSPEAAGVMQTIGAPEAMVQGASPVQVNPTAALQAAAQNPAMLPALVKAGVITEEQATQMAAQIAAQGTAENQQAIDLQRQKDDAAMERARLRGGPSGGTAPMGGRPPIGTTNKANEAVQGTSNVVNSLDSLEKYIQETPQAFSAKDRGLAGLGAAFGNLPIVGDAVKTAAEAGRGPESRTFGAMVTSAGVDQLRKFGGSDSNKELEVALGLLPKAQDSAETALYMTQQLKSIAAKQAEAARLYQADVARGGAPKWSPEVADQYYRMASGGGAPQQEQAPAAGGGEVNWSDL